MGKLISLLVISIFIFSTMVSSATGVIRVAGGDGGKYGGPEVRIAADGSTYIVYEANNDIHLSRLRSGDMEFLINLSSSGAKSYDPAMAIEDNGTIHVIWAEQSGTTHSFKYRYLSGSSWSSVINLTQVSDPMMDRIEDLRLVVDGAGNLASTFSTFLTNKTPGAYLMTKHGSDTELQRLPLGGLAKHPDVAIDSGTIHVLWQYKGHGEYTIMYKTKENRYKGNWGGDIEVKHSIETQRPRLGIDTENTPHAFYFEEYWDYINNPGRTLYYQYKSGSSFTGTRRISDPGTHRPYHYLSVSVRNSHNMVASMQSGGYSGGDGVLYNWMIDGQWKGYAAASLNSGARPADQCVTLSKTENVIYIAYADRDSAIYLYYNNEGGGQVDPEPVPNVPPVADFTFSPQTGVYPLDVSFNASASTDSDGSIVEYSWDFGDASIGNGVSTTHRYLQQGVYNITLTVKDDDGATASKSAAVTVKGIEKPINLAYKMLINSTLFLKEYLYKVTWDRNGANAALGINIKEYQIFRRVEGSGEYVYLTTVPAKDSNSWLDRSLKKQEIKYQYGIKGVDDKDRISDMLVL